MSNGKTICTVCDYIYEDSVGDTSQSITPGVKFEQLPESWHCPACQADQNMFQPCSCVSIPFSEQTCATHGSSLKVAAAGVTQEGENRSMINTSKTVGDLVVDNPARACVFEQYKIDYCCGGKIPLVEACEKRGLNANEVVEKLLAVDDKSHESGADWSKASLKSLIEHIISTYHQPLREQLPRVAQLAEKVARVHGENHPEMVEVSKIFQRFRDQLEFHMQKEEAVLFPAIARMEAGADAPAFGCGGGIDHPIGVMTQEHDDAGEALSRMRELTNDFAPPADACNSFKVLLYSLGEITSEMHQHVHKENNILFPRALAEASKKTACTH